jgi:hypothetical protein
MLTKNLVHLLRGFVFCFCFDTHGLIFMNSKFGIKKQEFSIMAIFSHVINWCKRGMSCGVCENQKDDQANGYCGE